MGIQRARAYIKKTLTILRGHITNELSIYVLATTTLWLSVFLIPVLGCGQSHDFQVEKATTEELLQKLANSPRGCEKGILLNELSYRCLFNEPAFSRSNAQSALMIGLEFDCQQVLSSSYNRLGAYHSNYGSLDSGISYYESCLLIRQNLNDSIGLYGVLKNLGDACRKAGFQNKSLEYLSKAKKYCKGPSALARVEVSAVNTLRAMGRFSEAIKAMHRALRCLDNASVPISTGHGDARLTYSYLYDDQSDYKNALTQARRSFKYYKKAGSELGMSRASLALGNAFFHLHQLDSSLIFFKRFYAYKSTTEDSTGIGKALVNIGQVFLYQRSLDSARFFLRKAFEHYESTEDAELGFLVNEKMADLCSSIDPISACLEYYDEAYKLAMKLDDVVYQMDVMHDYAQALRKAGNYQKSSEILSAYTALIQKVKKDLQKAKAYELELEQSRYKLAQQEKLIMIELSEKRLMQIYLLAGLGVLVVITFLLFYLIERHRRKIASKNRELNSIANILEIQEKERQRIAQDLHDRLGGTLATVRLLFSDVQQSIGELQQKSKETYSKALNILEGAGAEVRMVAHDLRTATLSNFGLEAALKELGDTIQRSESINFDVIMHGMQGRLSADHESHLYRMVQEMVSNTLKHANATDITLQLVLRDERLSLVYEDNGDGFDTKNARRGMGLNGIEARVEKLHGSFEIDSGKGGGTTYNIDIPIKWLVK